MDGFIQSIEKMRDAASEVAINAVARLPSLLGAVTLVLIGWLVARFFQ